MYVAGPVKFQRRRQSLFPQIRLVPAAGRDYPLSDRSSLRRCTQYLNECSQIGRSGRLDAVYVRTGTQHVIVRVTEARHEREVAGVYDGGARPDQVVEFVIIVPESEHSLAADSENAVRLVPIAEGMDRPSSKQQLCRIGCDRHEVTRLVR
jgi:hypothetical protein